MIERVTKDWDAPFDVIDLLTAYIVKPDKHHMYSLFSRARGDKILVQNTQVNDRQWKVRYAFAFYLFNRMITGESLLGTTKVSRCYTFFAFRIPFF